MGQGRQEFRRGSLAGTSYLYEAGPQKASLSPLARGEGAGSPGARKPPVSCPLAGWRGQEACPAQELPLLRGRAPGRKWDGAEWKLGD